MKWQNKYRFDFYHPVVLVIDMQNDFCHKDGAYYRNDPETFQVAKLREVIPTLRQFLIDARKEHIPIAYCKFVIDGQGRDAGIYPMARPFLKKEGLRKSTWGAEITVHRISSFLP